MAEFLATAGCSSTKVSGLESRTGNSEANRLWTGSGWAAMAEKAGGRGALQGLHSRRPTSRFIAVRFRAVSLATGQGVRREYTMPEGAVLISMQIIHNLAQARLAQDTVITIGAFDGIHLGHQAILGQLVKRAKQLGCLSNVVTFQPHPRAVLYPALGTKWLTTLDEKIMLMSQIGLDVVTVIAFTKKMADMSAQDFVAELQGKLHMRELWIGADFALGRGREGNARALSVIASAGRSCMAPDVAAG